MKRLSLSLAFLLLLSVCSFADTIGTIQQATQDFDHFTFVIMNTSSIEYSVTIEVTDLLGNPLPSGPWDCLPFSGCVGSGFGGYSTSGNWTVDVVTPTQTFDITNAFAAVGDTVNVSIDTPAQGPPPSSTPEPSTLALLAIGVSPASLRLLRRRARY